MKFLLELDHIECRYQQQSVVRDFSLHLQAGAIACLLGPSGCGKTTVLRAIAGFQPLTAGAIRLRDRTVATPAHLEPPEQRQIGMVFQDYALFPHLSVLANVLFGVRDRPARERQRLGLELLELVGLAEYAARYPHELSGGQQQRVALARALAPQPDLVLLDEPFSSLDVALRERLSYEVHDILKSRGVSALMVTHDQHEAFAMGEKVGVMHQGRLLQWDTPYNLYHEPADRFVADFIGQGRFVAATLLTSETLDTEVGVIHGNRAFLWPPGSRVDVLLRPDDVVPDMASPLKAVVLKKAFKGAETLYTLRLNEIELLALFPSHLDHRIGERVGVRVEVEHLVAFARV